MEFFVSFAIFVAVFVLLSLYWRRRSSAGLDPLMPGPPSSPLIGNLLQIDLSRPHLTMSDWFLKYGGIYRVRFGFNREVVVVSDYESIKETLVVRGRELSGRPRPYRVAYTSNGYRNIGFGVPIIDRWWKPLRNGVRKELKATGAVGLRRLEAVTREIACKLSTDIATDGNNGSRPVDIRRHLYAATLNIISTFLAGAKFEQTDKEFQMFTRLERLGVVFVSSAGGSGAELDAFPFLRFFRHPICRRLDEFQALRNDLFNRMKELAERNATSETAAHGENPLVWTLINMVKAHQNGADDGDDDGLTEEHVKGAFTDLLLGGMSSSTNLIYALVNILLHNHDVYRQLKAELKGFQRARTAGRHHCRYPSLSDRSNLPYTQATLLELLRYVCIAPFTVPHVAVVDTTVCGYRLPKGTEVLPNLWSLHHNPDLWDEPWRFNPTRFLEPDGLSIVPADHPHRRHLMPFGAGTRRCTGEAFAFSRLFLIVTHLMTDFDIDLSTPEEHLVSCDPQTYGLGIALYPMDYTVQMIPTEVYREQNESKRERAG